MHYLYEINVWTWVRKCGTLHAFFFFILIFSSACKKYPEGAYFNFTSKCKRIERSWKIEHIVIDGLDSAWYLKQYNDSGVLFDHFEFLKEYTDRTSHGQGCAFGSDMVVFCRRPNDTYAFEAFTGTAEMSEDRKYLYFESSDRYNKKRYGLRSVGPLFVNDKLKFRIKKLTKTALWLDITYNGVYSWIHFSRN